MGCGFVAVVPADHADAPWPSSPATIRAPRGSAASPKAAQVRSAPGVELVEADRRHAVVAT